jgi:hypothetical protein
MLVFYCHYNNILRVVGRRDTLFDPVFESPLCAVLGCCGQSPLFFALFNENIGIGQIFRYNPRCYEQWAPIFRENATFSVDGSQIFWR